MNILNVTSLIRNNFIDGKQNENPILFDIANEFSKSSYNINFGYLYLHPYSNGLIDIVNKKWKQYSFLSKKKSFISAGHLVYTLPLFLIPSKTVFNCFFFWLTTILYKKRIHRVVKEFKPTLIQAQDIDQSAYVARYIYKTYNIPYVLVPRGILQKRFGYINKNILDASALICHGYLHLNRVRKDFHDKVKVLIPHGVDRLFFSPNSGAKRPSDKIKIISIGRLLALKNFDLLIKGVSKFESMELDIYGQGAEQNNLTSLISDLGVGHRVKLITEPFLNKDLPEIFKKYDLFALLSFPETFGRVFAEAIVSGLPIIGVKETGLYGQLEQGVNGFFIEPGNEIELEQLFNDIIATPNKLLEMKTQNLRAKDKFSWDIILNQYYTLYESIQDERNKA